MYVAMKSRLSLINKILLVVMFSLFCCCGYFQAGRVGTTKIPFKATATGGTLVFGHGRARSPDFVSVNTFAGESAELVVSRLATAIAHSNRIFDYSGTPLEVRDAIAARTALGNTLELRAAPAFFVAGTETGLGIPKPPLFLSCSYDKQADEFQVKWNNPLGEYGYIDLRWHFNKVRAPGKYHDIDVGPYSGTVREGGDRSIPATATSYTIKKPANVKELDLDLWLVGLHPMRDNTIPSALTAIHVTGDGYCQEEINGIPFFAGLAPNWAAWSMAPTVDKAAFEQGDKYDNLPAHMPAYYPTGLLTKPFYQVIKAPPQGFVHGVYRKFLGLTPGHTYRLTACLTTLDMDSIEGPWSFSLHAAPAGQNGEDFTAQQLAGLAPLPDGRMGSEAGRICCYNQNRTTEGSFALVFSGDGALDGTNDAHITLPSGVDTLTVWARFSCTDPTGKVGFSGVRLADITALTEVKPPEKVTLEEFKKQARLLKLIKKSSH